MDGATVPSVGWDLPDTTDNLRAGTLGFRTTQVFGDCKEFTSATGIVTAQFVLSQPTGQPRFPGKSYAGTFDQDLKTGKVTLRAPRKSGKKFKISSVDGSVTGNEMRFDVGIPYIWQYRLLLKQ